MAINFLNDGVFKGDVTISSGVINLGSDVSIFRDGINILRTDDKLHANNDIYLGGAGKIFDRANSSNYIELADTIVVSTALYVGSDITVAGGDITLQGTGRIQGIDTVSAATDATSKSYVDNAISGAPQGTVTGSGVNNRLALWNGTTAIDSDSDFYVDGNTIFTTNLEASANASINGQFGQGVTIANKVAAYGAEFRANFAGAQIFFGRSGNNIGSGAIGADSTYMFKVWKTSDFSSPFVIQQDGKVGIGLTDPDSRLDINAGVSAATVGPAVRISKGASPIGLIRYDTLVVEANDVATIRIGESDGTISTIMSGDNNMRINSTDPIKFYTAGTTTGEGHQGQGGTLALTLDNSQNSTFTGNLIAGTGNISMDGSSSGQVKINGAGYSGAIALDATAMRIYHNSSSRDLVLGTNETARLTIAGSGNIQIANSLGITGNLTVTGGDVVLGGTGRIQGVDTVTANTDAANKAYVDTAVAGAGSGTFLPLAGGTMTGDIVFNDNVAAAFGTGIDAFFKHSGSDFNLFNDTGNVTFTNRADNKDFRFATDNGSGGTTTYFTIDGLNEINQFSKNVSLSDNIRAKFGNSSDLQIYHDGSNSFIQDTGTGDLYIDAANNFFVRNQANGEVWIKGTDAGVSLRYQDSQKLITSNTGITVTGNIDGVANMFLQDYIYHSGDGNTYMGFSGTDTVVIRTNGSDKFTADANSAILLEAGITKLQTTGTGIAVTGTATGVFSGNIATTGDGQNNYPFRLGADFNSYMVSVAGNTWGLFWAGNQSARYGTNGNGGPGNIWGNSSNPNEFVFAGSDLTRWTLNGNTGDTWQNGDIYVGGGDIILSGTGRIQGVDTVSATTDAANKAYVDSAISSAPGAPAIFTRSNINSSAYTMIATVNGDRLASIIQMTITGTSNSVVFACTFDITVNHFKDIHVKSMNGDYQNITIRITSNNNEDFSIEAKHNGGTNTQAEVVIFPKANEVITATTVDPGYTGTEYEHEATEGWRFGGTDSTTESSNVIVDGKIGIGITSPPTKLSIDSATFDDHITLKRGSDQLGISPSGGQLLFEGGVTPFNNNSQDLGRSDKYWKEAFTYSVRSGGALAFKTNNGSQRMTISSGGDVGIGTTTNTTIPLHVNQPGSGTIIKASGISATIEIQTSTAGNATLYQRPNSTGDKEAEFKMTASTAYGWSWKSDTSTKFMKLDQNPGTLTVKGDVVAYGSPSDISLKENIKPIDSALDKVMKLQGVTFDWKKTDSVLELKEDIGFIAQDVQKVVPELVRENANGLLSMRHQGVTPILLEAIKELKAEIEELKKQIK